MIVRWGVGGGGWGLGVGLMGRMLECGKNYIESYRVILAAIWYYHILVIWYDGVESRRPTSGTASSYYGSVLRTHDRTMIAMYSP